MSRLDRYGEAIEDDDQPTPTPTPHDSRCDGGWLGDDDLGRPIPCLRCRPHLRRSDV